MAESRIVEGKELELKLREFSATVQSTITFFALRKAGQVVVNAIEEEIKKYDDPSTPTNISRNLAMRKATKRTRATGNPSYRIGFQGGARDNKANEGAPGGNTFYWRFIEFGTSRIAGKYPVTTATQRAAQPAATAFISAMNKKIQSTARAISKRKANRSAIQNALRELNGLED